MVYTTVFLKELLPADSTLRRGLEEGAVAALEARGETPASEQGDEEAVVASLEASEQGDKIPAPKRATRLKAKSLSHA